VPKPYDSVFKDLLERDPAGWVHLALGFVEGEPSVEGIPAMRESDTYQMILEEGRTAGREEGREVGRVEEARPALLLVGTPRLGEPDPATAQRIADEASLEQIEEWLRRAGQVETWAELPGLSQ
jgi:predicted transposase YdaD